MDQNRADLVQVANPAVTQAPDAFDADAVRALQFFQGWDTGHEPEGDAAHLAHLNQAFIWAMTDEDGATYKDWLALQQNATGLCLSHYRPLFGVELATSSAAEVSLTCAWQPTIPSQGSQSFTQFVDFGGESLSLMPPGNSERQDADERLG